MNRKIKIEAVTVCVNYSDFLAVTLPHNKQFVDRLVVITDTKDEDTKRICDFYEVECIQTDVFYEDNAKFNKGKGINKGLELLDKDGWVLHFDSDIWFSPHLRVVLENRHLDSGAVYGIDRLMCHSYEDWVKFVSNPSPINEQYYLVQANAFKMGSRVAHYNQADGWFPIGFFQLWNPKGSSVDWYPTQWSGADHTDVVFSKLFPLGRRHLIPETYVIHLDSEKAYMGKNWYGRKTQYFGPSELSNIVDPLTMYRQVSYGPGWFKRLFSRKSK